MKSAWCLCRRRSPSTDRSLAAPGGAVRRRRPRQTGSGRPSDQRTRTSHSSRSAGILSSTAAAMTATAEAEEARVGWPRLSRESAAAQSAAAWSAVRAASGRQCGVVWRRECRHRDPTVRRRTDQRPRSLAGLNPPGWELSFAMLDQPMQLPANLRLALARLLHFSM
jgi:hypothetical protein